MSKIEKIERALIEAHRFTEKAKAWKQRLLDDQFAGISGSKEGGAAKRASMDLTRALVELRK